MTRIEGTGWDVHFESHVRFFRAGKVAWPSLIHSEPVVSGDTACLPPDCDVHVRHECFADLTQAWGKFNTYSGVEASERHESGTRSTWQAGLLDATRELLRRYQPEIDGGYSFALSFGLFFYRLGVHLKEMELSGDLQDLPMPSAGAMTAAWSAFTAALKTEDVANIRRAAEGRAARGDVAGAIAVLHNGLGIWGAVPELILESAVIAARGGQADQALALCDRVLQADPRNPEAQATRIAVEVATGRRPPVNRLLLGRELPPIEGELVVAPGEEGGDLEAPFDNLPFAPGSITGIRISAHRLGPAGLRHDRKRASLEALLAPAGRLEVVGSASTARIDPVGTTPTEKPDDASLSERLVSRAR